MKDVSNLIAYVNQHFSLSINYIKDELIEFAV